MHTPPIQVATIILAGGQGTRLYPLTIHHSKPAVSYGGRYRLIDIPISNSINSNFRNIFVIAQYLSTELQHHINQTYHFDAFNPGSIDVLTPQENEKGEKQWFKGTADAVRKNLSIILKSPAEFFLILSGDQLYNIHFLNMVKFAQEANADLTIASIPVSEKEATRMGLLKINEHNLVLDFVEKPKDLSTVQNFRLKSTTHPYLASMGIYVFKREALISLLKLDERDDFGFHLIDTAVKTRKTLTFIYDGYWEDIGTIASYYDANLILTKTSKGLNTYDEQNPIYTRPTFLPGPKISGAKITNSIICEGSVIEAEEISNCVIGLRSYIGKGTVIRDTVMMGNHFYMPPNKLEDIPHSEQFSIGSNCVIEKTIIDEFVRIGNHVNLTNKKGLSEYDGNGIFIRDGIIIVPSGTYLPDYFEI
ncbi:MAG TPA: sugar phosphate nucleotidyltransferase [Chlamydiales bacterium]|nr:sugar phosphate nucleotidyltransferase [Chlamydiales bacterium]